MAAKAKGIEVWGGVECSVVRVNGTVIDQTLLSGHQDRPEDLDAFAALGLKAIRYPVLWERVAPDGLERADWRWTDERLGRLRELGVRTIAALLHHGHGPADTDLMQPDFPERFAAYAGAVAARYPWLDAYTPVNEPLTTARFCGLYGHWHPHARDAAVYRRILVNQIRATVLAMRAIRRVNPAAKLMQTEDLGKCFSTPRLAERARYENERRWLTFDLLAGRVVPGHPLWGEFADAGFGPELEDLAAAPCPPDVLGIDHYLTSERFLDHRFDRYPGIAPAAESGGRWVDVEAIRVVAGGTAGLEALLEEAWERYRLPIAATEVHNGSSREEQLRWFREAWDAAGRLKARGVDIRAVTAWSLLGATDWNSLMTRRDGFYESGVFDTRGPVPRPTALAGLIRDLAHGGTGEHPAAAGPGWWRREERFIWAPVRACPFTVRPPAAAEPAEPARPLLIAGSGALADALARACAVRGLAYRRVTRAELDLAEEDGVAAALARLRPWAVVNAAGFTSVDQAEYRAERCRRDNLLAAEALARECAAAGLPLLAFSSHLVFGGAGSGPWREDDLPDPLGVYATSKRLAEAAVLARHPATLVVRSGPFFGPWDERNPAARAIRAAAAGETVTAAADVTVSPTYLPDLVNVALDLLIDGERGLWHLANPGAVTWAEFLRAAVRGAGLDEAAVVAKPAAGLGWIAPRPACSVLATSRGAGLPSLDSALGRFLADREPVEREGAEAFALAEAG